MPLEQPIRVALLLPDLNGGGAELVVLRLAEGLVQRGLTVDLVLGQVGGGHQSNIPPGVNVVDLGLTSRLILWKIIALARYLRSTHPAALIASLDVMGSSQLARLAAQTKTPIIQWIHTNLSLQIPNTSNRATAIVRRLAIRSLYPQADAIVAVSEGVARDIAGLAGVQPEEVEVVYNPIVHPHILKMGQAPVSHPWFRPGEPPVILGVGRLVKQKDFATLIRAFAQVRKHRVSRLVILGGPDPRELSVTAELQKLTNDLDLAADVSLPGFVQNPYAYMMKASALAVSSIYEGFAIVIAEALALGTPVVATDCPSGPAEALAGGRYGPLVPVGDYDALARAILSVMNAPLPKEVLVQRGSMFSMERGVDGHLAVIRRVAGNPVCRATSRPFKNINSA